MIRALTVSAFIVSLPAWAVGEHIKVTGPAKEQLKETLCISMECNAGGDVTVSSRIVGNQMELKVIGPSGPRFTTLLRLTEDGNLSNSDAMTATSQLVTAIENPAALKQAAPEKTEKPAVAEKWSAAKKAKWAKIQAKKKLARHALASR